MSRIMGASGLVPAIAAVLLAASAPAGAASGTVGAGCSDIRFDPAFLQAYPRAPAACQEVVTKNGKKLVRCSAQVSKVEKDHFQLHFLNAVGKPIEPVQTLTLLPQAGQKVRVNGKDVPYAELRKGDKVDFWVPEKSVGAYTDPNATALTTIVVP